MVPAAISNGSPRAASFSPAATRTAASIASRASSALLRKSPFDGDVDMVVLCRRWKHVGKRVRKKKRKRKKKCEAANAVEALDPGVPYESRWAPYDRIHGPGQGQFPKGSIRPRGYWLLTRDTASPKQCSYAGDKPPALTQRTHRFERVRE